MANNYLTKFRSLVGKTQSEQILRLLNKQRDSGQIQTLEEFSAELQRLITELTSQNIIPTLKLYQALANDVISSETYNFMLERIEDDLQTAFQEAIKISEVQADHTALVRDIILKNIRAGIHELESKITLYKFLNTNSRGFTKALFNTFREVKKDRTNRDNQFGLGFTDVRTNLPFEFFEDAEVDVTEERLELSKTIKDDLTIAGIEQIYDDTSLQSAVIVEVPSLHLSNIIDKQKDTFWAQSILFRKRQDAVYTKLKLDLGGLKQFNSIEIEPAVIKPIILHEIYYIGSNNEPILLASPDREFDGPISVSLETIAAKELILVFKNENGIITDFKQTLDTLQRQRNSKNISPAIKNLQEDLDKIVRSQKVKDLLGVTGNKPGDVFIGWDYRIGFDNIRVTYSTYSTKSIFISAPIEINTPAIIGLKTKESRPYWDQTNGKIRHETTTYDLPIDKTFVGSIEYYVLRQDLTKDNTILRTTLFPIMPLGINRIYHERLLLTSKTDPAQQTNDTGELIFFTNPTAGNVKVYRNGIEMPDITATPTLSEGWIDLSSQADRTPNNNKAMKMTIQVKGNLPGDMWTVSYNPLESTTIAIPGTLSEYLTSDGLKVVDLVGDLSSRLLKDKVEFLDKRGPSADAFKSRLFLVIILRRNSADESVSPAVEEYLFSVGHIDKTRFNV